MAFVPLGVGAIGLKDGDSRGKLVTWSGHSPGRANTRKEKEDDMPVVEMIPEGDADGKVKEIYEEIRNSLGIDFVPNMYKMMAVKPDFLEANWKKVKAVMVQPGKLDRMTREIIAVAVSAVMGCEY
jgi:alkylhydroperoxidase/carboxymuconolactone decarboxylase family protein YurZ